MTQFVDSIERSVHPNLPALKREDRRFYPVYPFALRGATLATEGNSVAILRDMELQQDGLYSRRAPNGRRQYCRIRAFAGAWPLNAYALCEAHDDDLRLVDFRLLQWKAGAWTRLRSLPAEQALLSGNEAGKVFLAESITANGQKGVALRQLNGPSYTLARGANGCMTRLVAARKLEANDRNDVLLEGGECGQPNQVALEFWSKGTTRGVPLSPELEVLYTSALDFAGNVWVAGQRKGQTNVMILRFDGAAWSEHSVIDAHEVASMAIDRNGTLWLVAKFLDQPSQLMEVSSEGIATRATLPPNIGAAQWLKMVHGTLWVGAENALLSTEQSANAWDWIDVGVPYPLTVAPQRSNDRWGDCPRTADYGGYVVVLLKKSKTPDIAEWSKEYTLWKNSRHLESREVHERAFEAPNSIAIMTREGEMYFWGILEHKPSNLFSLLHPFPASTRSPNAYCANPTSFSQRRIEQFLKLGSAEANQNHGSALAP